jgi:hypothetical protein
MGHWLTEWWSHTQNDPGQDVLIARDQEQCGILWIFDVWFFPIQVGRYEPRIWLALEVVISEFEHAPRLSPNHLKADGLYQDANGDLTQ